MLAKHYLTKVVNGTETKFYLLRATDIIGIDHPHYDYGGRMTSLVHFSSGLEIAVRETPEKIHEILEGLS